ncbi:MAG: MscL family protein [Nitrososphaerota archaeon]|jgi:large conductance mechanosensitive channel|nr:MscL family protein [Nitrososphaerota archaeon]MDG6952821.1 MscL family protein [Nitrososphaerota archaeon]MDG6956138.1 MscL family protein [Nitrososphaerota archaeon]MDG6957729.1 MscL family protein [Nitrososphaerota archaeon]MDG6959021.1 MscL family protein [Nitrososphaerota archaeon]
MSSDKEIITELQKIRELLTPKPAPPAPPPPKGISAEFKAFLINYKVLGLAVAFILGVYLGGLVQALVSDLLLPAIGIPLSSIGNLSTLTVTFANQHFLIGGFLIAVITFIIVAFVIFLIVKIASHYKIQ